METNLRASDRNVRAPDLMPDAGPAQKKITDGPHDDGALSIPRKETLPSPPVEQPVLALTPVQSPVLTAAVAGGAKSGAVGQANEVQDARAAYRAALLKALQPDRGEDDVPGRSFAAPYVHESKGQTPSNSTLSAEQGRSLKTEASELPVRSVSALRDIPQVDQVHLRPDRFAQGVLASACKKQGWEMNQLQGLTDVGRVTQLASGHNNVYEASMRAPGGGLVPAIFKACDADTAGTNLATAALARQLGFDVIVETRPAFFKDPYSSFTGEPKFGIVMERADGVLLEDLDDSASRWLDDADLARKITKLQLLDHLTAQEDRQDAHIAVEAREGAPLKVRGYDNDWSFRMNCKDPNDIGMNNALFMFIKTAMPPVIDEDMARAIEKLEPSQLNDLLSSHLPAANIGLTATRLEVMKLHVSSLRGTGGVVSCDDWNQTWAAKISVEFGRGNSYLGALLEDKRRWDTVEPESGTELPPSAP